MELPKAPIDKANEQTNKDSVSGRCLQDASGFNSAGVLMRHCRRQKWLQMQDMTIRSDDVEAGNIALKDPAMHWDMCITVTAKDGSQGSITFSVGIKNDGTVNGYSITDISETPGLGMKAEEEDVLQPV